MQSTIAIFGEILADVFPDQTVLGGAPFNVARHLQAFGQHPLLISRIGQDALAETLLQHMTTLGIDTRAIQRDNIHPTGEVRVTLTEGGHCFDILPNQAYDHIDADSCRASLAPHKPVLAYFGTLALRQTASRAAAEQFLAECDCPVFLDINLRAPWYNKETITWALQTADIVKLNDEELATVADMQGLRHLDAIAQSRVMQQQFELQKVLVTCGEHGGWLLDEHQHIHRTTPPQLGIPIADTVGAGDAFAAVFMLGWLRGWDMPTTLQRASDYAAWMCTIRGAAPPAGHFPDWAVLP